MAAPICYTSMTKVRWIREATLLNDGLLPFPTAEQQNTQHRQQRVAHHDTHEDAARAENSMERQEVRQRNLADPETYDIQHGGSERVSGAVERRGHHHSVGVGNVAVAQ